MFGGSDQLSMLIALQNIQGFSHWDIFSCFHKLQSDFNPCQYQLKHECLVVVDSYNMLVVYSEICLEQPPSLSRKTTMDGKNIFQFPGIVFCSTLPTRYEILNIMNYIIMCDECFRFTYLWMACHTCTYRKPRKHQQHHTKNINGWSWNVDHTYNMFPRRLVTFKEVIPSWGDYWDTLLIIHLMLCYVHCCLVWYIVW